MQGRFCVGEGDNCFYQMQSWPPDLKDDKNLQNAHNGRFYVKFRLMLFTIKRCLLFISFLFICHLNPR